MAYDYDPELAPIVELLPSTGLDDLAAARRGIRELVDSLPPFVAPEGMHIEGVRVPGSGGPDVGVRVYRPATRAPVAGVLVIHGGGFVMGDLETQHAEAGRIAEDLGGVVVAVDYRLAPEHPFPAALDDCYAAAVWMDEHHADLGIDADRMGVVGTSAGGGLAAGLTLLARDRGGPVLRFQLLDVPELDDRLETPSMQRFDDTPLWNRPSAALSWRHYLGDVEPGSAAVSPYAAPARAEDLSGLPSAYVSTCELDPLRDEGIDYAQRLMQAGVSVELHTFPGTFHGSVIVAEAAVSRRMQAEKRAALHRGLSPR